MPTPIKLYNTMSRKLEEFKPIVPGKVGIYGCGPTVYWHPHLGNMRTSISNDLIKRMLIQNGYEVTHVMNYTDVGHLVGDEDEGAEDKMEKGAVREGKSVWEIAQMYIGSVISDMAAVNNIPPTFTPRATDYIQEQIDLIKKLEELGYAYIIPGRGVYYDTAKFADYGALSGRDLSKQLGGVRISDEGKRSSADFVLWAFLPDDAKNEMIWDSPWGRGFPGWHIECSAMSMKLLGKHFDIHTAAAEHINIHHTNEIAQSEPVVGKPWVSYWVHFGFLMAKDGKIAKSAGDALTIPYIKGLGYDPMHFRYMMLLGHYRQPMDFTFAALDAAAAGYKNIVRKLAVITGEAKQSLPNQDKYNEWHDKILSAVNDNLKTAVALTHIQELLADDTVDAATKYSLFKFIDDLLGLQFIDQAQKLLAADAAPIPAEIQALVDARIAAKVAKDWAKADQLRDAIDSAGYTVMDGKDGMSVKHKV
ncbi:MAG: cysteine--tRNA ligase [Alphaproteobacteria bacterium]|nr:cysteine--tRNA ligase [Alphaproteobacteria bacterium]